MAKRISSTIKDELIGFLFYLRDKRLINDYDFNYEKEVNLYLKKITKNDTDK